MIMIRINPHAIELAKNGIFAAFGSVTRDGEKVQIEIDDDLLQASAQMALKFLAWNVLGQDVYLEED